MINKSLCYAKRMKLSLGFTVVELVIVIAVISVLFVIGTFAWSSWEESMDRSTLETELSTISIAMDQHQNFNDRYPLSLPDSYKPGQNVTATYKSGSASNYCIEARLTDNPSLVYKVSDGEVSEGAC